MKKGLLYIMVLIGFGTFFAGCIKPGKDRTVNTAMTADLVNYNFNATSVEPATITPQLNDSSTTLIITGTDHATGNQIMISIVKFTKTNGTFSIADHKATASYTTLGVTDMAASGVISIKDQSTNVITGYFSFTTLSGITITNGTFVVGKPWVY